MTPPFAFLHSVELVGALVCMWRIAGQIAVATPSLPSILRFIETLVSIQMRGWVTEGEDVDIIDTSLQHEIAPCILGIIEVSRGGRGDGRPA